MDSPTPRPVYQRESHDCLRACVETLLGVAGGTLPYIDPRDHAPDLPGHGSYWSAWTDALAPYGYRFAVHVEDARLARRVPDALPGTPGDGYSIAVVPQRRGGKRAAHAVVMRGASLFHEPNHNGRKRAPRKRHYTLTLEPLNPTSQPARVAS